MAGAKQQLRSSRIYKDGKFYYPNNMKMVVALSPYGLMGNRYQPSDNHDAIINIKKKQI